MTDNAGQHKHSFNGRAIYANADGGKDRSDEDKKKEKAVRKIVRVIIEENGGEGTVVKTNIDTNYHRGIVWWYDARVAAWDTMEQRMVLKGASAPYQAKFDELMK